MDEPGAGRAPLTRDAALDMAEIEQTAAVATRLLDNVAGLSRFPLAQQKEAAQAHAPKHGSCMHTGVAGSKKL